MKPTIEAGDLVGAVLDRDATLIDVFVRHSAHFTKLRNPMLRRTMGRLVTVEQAAGIAGIAAEVLVRDLNAAVGASVQNVPQHEPVPSATRLTSPSTAVTRPQGLRDVYLDLREDLGQGREPFSRIMAAVGGLMPDEALHLRAIFEPVPLYSVLGKRGFSHSSLSHAADDWSVWFWRGDHVPRQILHAAVPGAPPPGEHWIDVRGLEPPEPMVRTLAALEGRPPGETLVQVNVRVPQFLLPILAERGFAAEIDDTQPDRVLVRVRHRD